MHGTGSIRKPLTFCLQLEDRKQTRSSTITLPSRRPCLLKGPHHSKTAPISGDQVFKIMSLWNIFCIQTIQYEAAYWLAWPYRNNFVLFSVNFLFIPFSLFLASLSLKSGSFHWLLTVWRLHHKKKNYHWIEIDSPSS